MAVRVASTDEFVAVDLHGGVYHCDNGNFTQVVGPIPSFRAVGSVGSRSVMIAPDGVICGIHPKNQWSLSALYQLVPK
jgi:hypothetical protein